MKQMLYNDNTKLSQHISEEAYSALQTYLGYWGMDISALEVYRPWAVSSTLDTLLIQDADFDSERVLITSFLPLPMQTARRYTKLSRWISS